jgi:hypothetical protein
MRNGHNKDAPGPLRRAEGKPTSYPGLFQGPKRLGHQAWELAPTHRLLRHGSRRHYFAKEEECLTSAGA